jgi:hypothetical protein
VGWRGAVILKKFGGVLRLVFHQFEKLFDYLT